MNNQQYKCMKCGSTQYKVDEMRATGGPLAKIFDVQNKKFTTVSCQSCGFTEFYKGRTSGIGNVFDFFTG
jgi:predicted nucleic-acid-binding Zn-ribbon protein